MSVRIFHNPRCSKSREAMALLQARELLRSGAAAYQELGLERPDLGDEQLLQTVAAAR